MKPNTAAIGGPDGRSVFDRRAVRRGQHDRQAELFGARFAGAPAESTSRGGSSRDAGGRKDSGAAAGAAPQKRLVGQAAREIPADADWREAARNRLAKHSRRAPDSDCVLWTGKTNGKYGAIAIHGATYFVHRVAFALAKGPLSPLLQVDHLCFERTCINPAHLEAVEMRENVRRAWLKARMRTGSRDHGAFTADRVDFGSTAQPPTPRQRMALRAISDFMEQHGWAPTTRELCRLTGIRSTNGMQDHLKALHRRGLITRGEGARTLALTDAGRKALAC